MARSLTAAEALEILGTTPKRLADATAGVAPDRLHARPEAHEWSASEVLTHLRSCSDVWGPVMLDIATRGVTAIRAVNPRTWAEQVDYGEEGFSDSLRVFTRQRTALMKVLQTLADDDWAKAATVTGAGAPLTKTVLSYADRMARHERAHLGQIARALR